MELIISTFISFKCIYNKLIRGHDHDVDFLLLKVLC